MEHGTKSMEHGLLRKFDPFRNLMPSAIRRAIKSFVASSLLRTSAT
jgi:hypothetical protein